MEKSGYQIRVMSKEDLSLAVEWAAEEGWNPGLHDAASFFAADPNGFLMGYLNGEPISSISVVKYSNGFGFLGFYIVKPEYRGKGYGLAIWQAGLEYLAGCNIGLDGVVDQQANYRRSGFSLAYGNIRFEGLGGGVAPEQADIIPIDEAHFNEVLCYDSAFFPASRDVFLRHWLNQRESVALAIRRGGKLVGYGVIRPCQEGYKIGPLFADDVALAEDLFLALRAKASAYDPVYLDVPESNHAGVAMAGKYEMEPVFTTARMYTGEFPDISVERTFGVTTFELG